MELNRQTKMAEIAKMKEAEKAIALKIDKLVSGGELEDEAQQRGCWGGCFPSLSRWGRSRVAQESGMEVAVFGQSAAGGSTASTNARLEKAAEQMENHAEQLYAKAGANRSKAKALMSQGKKQEAMLALKRAKALEKQAEVAASTHAAIEQQQEMLQSSALQREIASALSASIATTKKRTKGLLEKAEDAVDGSAELRDAAEEINEVMGGLAKTDDYDEDDLLDELEQMQREPDEEAVVEAAPTEAAAAKAEVEPQAIVVGIDPALYPTAPKAKREANREARQKLLEADSAAAQ